MIAVRVTCDTGRTWITSINATLPEAVDYFMGQCFVDEDFETGEETSHSVESVVEVQS